jgi:hypothetical protein
LPKQAVFLKQLFVWVLLVLIPLNPASSQRFNVHPDTRMKAVFLYNFTKYIGWTTLDTAKTFTIGVFGVDEILVPLRMMAQERLESGQTINVLKVTDPAEIDDCEILFVPVHNSTAFHDLRPGLTSTNILFVGESLGFATSDGAINFVKRDGKIKLEINRQALKDANLTASSQLLKLAILVGEGETQNNE